MTLVTAKIDIAAPPEQVYEVMLDPERLHEWVSIHRRINHADGGEPRKGYEMDQTLCLRHANFKVHWTLTEADRPHRATWEGKGPAGSYARVRIRRGLPNSLLGVLCEPKTPGPGAAGEPWR